MMQMCCKISANFVRNTCILAVGNVVLEFQHNYVITNYNSTVVSRPDPFRKIEESGNTAYNAVSMQTVECAPFRLQSQLHHINCYTIKSMHKLVLCHLTKL